MAYYDVQGIYTFFAKTTDSEYEIWKPLVVSGSVGLYADFTGIASHNYYNSSSTVSATTVAIYVRDDDCTFRLGGKITAATAVDYEGANVSMYVGGSADIVGTSGPGISLNVYRNYDFSAAATATISSVKIVDQGAVGSTGVVQNYGTLTNGISVSTGGTTKVAALSNAGVIGNDVLTGIAISMSGGKSASVTNTGTINGNVVLTDGADTFSNTNGGILNGRVFGGKGDDTYIIETNGVTIIEGAGGGVDTLQTTISINLATNALYSSQQLENIQLNGTKNISATGNALGNTIRGNSGDNALDGGAGADMLYGGQGDDTYIVSDVNDVLIENLNEGTDTVLSSIDWTLGANFEKLTLTVDGTTGIGNNDDNIFSSNFLHQTFRGLDGNDTFATGSGNDDLYGGKGNDTYVLGAYAAVIHENAGEGTDTVTADFTYTLEANVENLVLTSSDAVNGFGNVLANTITGNVSVNTLDGGAGNDILYGGGGDDKLIGGTGADTMYGGDGNDTYYVDDPGDQVQENAGEGIDTVEVSFSYSLGANVENIVLTGAASANLTGNELSNSLTGNVAANVINGGAGDDFLDGGAGDDVLIGGTGADDMHGGDGNDAFYIDNAGDRVHENAGGGIDTVLTDNTYTLGNYIEKLLLTGAAAADGFGNALDNTLTGNTAANRLDGADGDDILDGGSGDDVLNGGIGNDTIGGGTGNDIVTGGDGIDLLTGGAGDDTLNGGAGADDMSGGAGDDTYIVDDIDDQIHETAPDGNDTVKTNLSYTLGNYIENLILTGDAASDGTGNGLDNMLTGNNLANRLDGKGGADKMYGGAGGDTYVVENAGDQVIEVADQGIDTVETSSTYTLGDNVENLLLTGAAAANLTGNELANALTGNEAANVLDGGAGADIMSGGAGDDSYYVDDIGDLANDSAVSGGLDIVYSKAVTFTLSEFIEKLTLLEAANISGKGNALGNVIHGNAGYNRLDGLGGADVINGHAGNDLIYGGDLNDQLVGDIGNDRLYGDSGNDKAYGGTGNDTLYGGIGNDTVYGDANNDLISGDAGNDKAYGGTGNDKLYGGAGNDTLYGDAGKDTLYGDAGNDRLYGGADKDVFSFKTGFGKDTIMDFRRGTDDIDLRTISAAKNFAWLQANTTDKGHDTVIHVGSNTITLHNVHESQLHASDFQF